MFHGLATVVFVYGTSEVFAQSFTLKTHFCRTRIHASFPAPLNLLGNKFGVTALAAGSSSGNPLNQPGRVSLHVIYVVTRDISFMSADGLVSEGEFLDITEIKRQQAEDYECITNNGVAPPDQRKVKVTVNCKYSLPASQNSPGLIFHLTPDLHC